MEIKYYTIQDPPPVLAEVKSELPDECRQSDFVPLPSLLEKFLISGANYTKYRQAQALSAEEKENLFESNDVADLADMDLVDQKAFIDETMAKVSQQEKEVVKEPTQATPEPEQAKKDATNAEEVK